ncbi:hypothetical protein BJ742DRAFT_327212 [Cladochytrium replicatum]|nr:hypothetical protein BJ742DRAFT_327212 [Cladochytrium replicatum]
MLVHFPKAPAIGPGHPRERILGVHVLNPAAVALATHQQTTAQGPALTWVGIQSIKRSARPAQLPRSWAENVVVAAQAVGKLLQNADIVGGLAAGSGFLPPPPAAEESKPENKEQPKETQSEPSSDAATAQATETQPNRSDESGAQKVDKTKSQKEDPPKSSTIENSDTNSDTAEMTPDGASDGIDAETPQPTPIAEAQGPQSTFEEEPHPGGETLVVQGDAVWSARMYEAEDTDIGRSMLGEVTKVFDYMAGTPAGQFGEDGDAKALRWWVEEPEIVSIKKWKYAYSVAPDEGVIVADGGAPAIEGAVKKTVHGFASADVGAPLFFAGDAFGYRLIETHVPGETAQSVPAEHAATVAAVSTTGADGATAAAAAVATASTTTVPAEQNEKQSQVNAVSETADAKAEAKEKGATVWSGFGSEVGGRGIEAAILSGAKVATAVSTTFTQ